MAINKLTVGGVEIPSVKSVTYKETVNSGVDLRPGCVASAYIEAEVYGTQADAVAPGAEVSYYLVDADSNETLIGVFTAEPSIKTKNSYKFIAYDNANKLNVDFSAWLRDHQADFPMTRAALVAAACTIAGVTNATPNWTGSTQTVQAFYSDGLTCRDILSYAAELSGFYVHCHADGNLYFHWYTATPNTRIYPTSESDESETRYAYKQDGLNYANYTVPAIDGVAVHPSGEDDVAYIYPDTPAGDNLLHIRNNILLTGAAASVYNAAAQRIYSQMTAVGAYVPATAQMFISECPYESGETVLVTDIQGVSFKTMVMSKTVTASGVTLESTGNEEQDAGYENTQKALVQLASDVVQINKLKVSWAEIDQAFIDYLTANDIVAQNLTIVDENGNVLATYDADGITLGETGSTRAEIDNASFELYHANDSRYFYAGDVTADNGGETDVLDFFVGNIIGTKTFTFNFRCESVNYVYVDGVRKTEGSDFTATYSALTFTTAPANGAVIKCSYKTTSVAPALRFGAFVNPIGQGGYSVALGKNNSTIGGMAGALSGQGNDAIGTYDVVCGGTSNRAEAYEGFIGGGAQNRAIAPKTTVCGGFGNSATSSGSAIVGGLSHTASGAYSFIGGGSNNKATSSWSAVCGGTGNQAGDDSGADTSVQAFVGGGTGNKATGKNSAIPGGEGLIASGEEQLVFGAYNAESGSSPDTFRAGKIEIVGNGTSNTARSNARTLDWSGNEWLAGGIDAASGSFRGNVDITDGFMLRRLPAVPSAGTGYWLARVTESNGTTNRGGIYFYQSSSAGEAVALSARRIVSGSNVSNELALYVDASGNRSVAVSAQAPWQKGLGMVYQAGDSITYTATGTNGYTIWAGNVRSGNFNVTIPLDKPVAAGVTADVTGQIILVHQAGVITVNLNTDVTRTVIISPSGITLHAVFNTTPSGITANRPCTFQSYGTTITFS